MSVVCASSSSKTTISHYGDAVGKAWVAELADEIRARGLHERAIWKISCRAEYVETDLFSRLRDAGLYLVYMGLESGSEEGLEVLNKRISVDTNLHAVQTLKDLDLLVEYGFMLFDPSSTFDSIKANVEFLRAILADGSGGAVFCRMLPYGARPSVIGFAPKAGCVVTFADPTTRSSICGSTTITPLLDRAVEPWVHGNGLSHQLNQAWHEVYLIKRLVGVISGLDAYRAQLAALSRESNEVLLSYVEASARAFAAGDEGPLRGETLHRERARLG